MYLSVLLMAFEGESSWLDYPGFELWKFFNLALFIAGVFILHRVFGRPISEGLRARRESIKAELIRARQERDEALKQLAEVEARLSNLDSEVEAIRQRSKSEAEAERERIKQATEVELAKLRESARREIEGAGKAAITELRQFASRQSVQLAEELIRREIRPEDEERLIRLRVEGLGGRTN